MNLFFCFWVAIWDSRNWVRGVVAVFLYFVSMSSSVGLAGCSQSVMVFTWSGLVSTSGWKYRNACLHCSLICLEMVASFSVRGVFSWIFSIYVVGVVCFF